MNKGTFPRLSTVVRIPPEDGYNQNGFHPATGMNRQGLTWDPNEEHEYNGLHDDADDGDDDMMSEFGEDGYDQQGFDRLGYDREGFDEEGYNREQHDRDGYGYDGYDSDGFDRWGFAKTGLDAEGYFDDGYDMEGFDRHGVSIQGLARNEYDSQGCDVSNRDVFGFDREGYDSHDYDPYGYDREGFDASGFNRYGYDSNGFDSEGYDERRRDAHGYSRLGYNAHHRDRAGVIEPGYCVASDGNIRRITNDGPSAAAMDCEHKVSFRRGSATCFACDWFCDIFHELCSECGTTMCRACSHSRDHQLALIRSHHPFPGSDSFGIQQMLERV